MTRDKWFTILADIQMKFPVLEKSIFPYAQEKFTWEGKGEVTASDDSEIPQQRDYIVFQGPEGKMKFEYVTRPIFVREKTLFSRRYGSDVKVEKVYDTNETMSTFHAFRWMNGGWDEIRVPY